VSPGFDGSGYRQRVLATLQRRSPLMIDDPFLVADLDPRAAASDTEEDLRRQLGAVLAFLQRERNSAKYKTLAAELIRRRGEWEGVLLTPALRAAARDKALADRHAGDAERYAKVDGYLATVRERFGGIPRSRVDGLRRLAVAAGVAAAEFDTRLARERVLEDTGGGVEPLAAGLRRQIREQLAELDRLRGGDRAGTATLWAFLGVPPDAGQTRLRAAYQMLCDANARRGHDREKTVTADLLAQVRIRLIDADPAAYTAGLVVDARDAVRPRVTEHVVLDDGLTPVATEGLVREVLGYGLGLATSQARAIVLEVARELGAAVTTGAAVDYVVCAGCGRPDPVHGTRDCRFCGAALYLACPSCGRDTEMAAVVCRHCGHNVRQTREALEALAAVRRALDAGRPREAGEVLGQARQIVAATGGASAARGDELAARVQAALGAADAGWRALAEDLASHRVEAATGGARWLSAQAADVPGPDGRTAGEVLAELTALQDVVRRRVAAARALPPGQQEAALAAVLRTAADDRDALAALAAVPLAPPTDLTADETDGAIVLRWRPSASASAGPVSYRVIRMIEPFPGGERIERGLGTTRSTELSDAGAPAGVVVWHEVTTTSGGRRSTSVCTPPMLLMRDVTDLRAELTGDAVALTWRLDAARDTVAIERAAEEPSPVVGSSPVRGPSRRISAAGGRYVDRDVQTGATYWYRVRAEYTDPSGGTARTDGSEVAITVLARPRPVLDLAADTDHGVTTLRSATPPGTVVRVYAAAVGSPVPPVDQEVPLAALAGLGRLVGEIAGGRLTDPAAAGAGEILYVPATASGGRAVIGVAVRHAVVERVRDLRASDRGDEIVLSFQMPAGITEARVLWRRDATPNGPDDPDAASAKVTNTSLEIKGGWHLAAPDDGWAYHVAVYPVMRSVDGVRVLPAGATLLARTATRMGPPPPARIPPGPHTGPVTLPHRRQRAGASMTPGMPPGSRGSSGAVTPSPSPSPRTDARDPVATGEHPTVNGRSEGIGPPPGDQSLSPPLPGGPPSGAPSPDALVREVSVSYALSRPGLRRRTLRVEVRADGPLPEMVLVARPGTVPPRDAGDGHAVGRMPASRGGIATGSAAGSVKGASRGSARQDAGPGPASGARSGHGPRSGPVPRFVGAGSGFAADRGSGPGSAAGATTRSPRRRSQSRTLDVPLGRAELPWAVRLVPALVPGSGPAGAGLVIRHPPDKDLVVR
jgi:hypothetical protein